ncbi:MAG: TolC family protein [Planctomycetota bacterium]
MDRRAVSIFMFVRVAILAALLLAPAGCRCTGPGCAPRVFTRLCAFRDHEPDAPRPDVASLVAEAARAAPAEFGEVAPARLEAIDLPTCQCLAAANADVATLLEHERHLADRLAESPSDDAARAFTMARNLLALRTLEKRNEAAGEAVQLFCRLAGVQSQRDWLERGIGESALALERIDRLESDGLPVPAGVDTGALVTQLQSLRDEREQLALVEKQLQLQLRRRLGCRHAGDRAFAAEIDWRPDLTPPVVDLATAEAISQRAELRALRHVLGGLDRATLPLARAAVQSVDGALGTVQRPPGPLSKVRFAGADEEEVAVRGRQLRRLLGDGVRAVTAEVHAAGAAVETQQARVRLALELVEFRREQLHRLEARRDIDRVTIFEIAASRGDRFRAEAALIDNLADLRSAQAALATASGLTAAACGHGARLCRLP